MATPLDKCPVCGGEIVEKEVEKVLRGGNLTETLHIQAEVCLRCGERLYTPEDVSRFEQIRSTLKAKGKANTQRPSYSGFRSCVWPTTASDNQG